MSSKTKPAVIGEKTHIEIFEETNKYLPSQYYNVVKKHLVQDVIFDEFVREQIDCSDKYNDNFYFNGKLLNEQEVRKLIANIEMEGFEILAYIIYMARGITTNQAWFDKTVRTTLENVYPQELVDSTYNYMKIPEELDKRITKHDFSELQRKINNNETIIPFNEYKKMYVKAISQMPIIDYESREKNISTDDNVK